MFVDEYTTAANVSFDSGWMSVIVRCAPDAIVKMIDAERADAPTLEAATAATSRNRRDCAWLSALSAGLGISNAIWGPPYWTVFTRPLDWNSIESRVE